ncbi:hypothetical protein AXJ14_gp030 [Geobacillus virus E3]|uniref:hypothetical protein n=1 Tax=Geobacillus virus E3 TaxID=1572712 RepID=UPI000671C7F1|nr:hypothetical protein AXJ14_gp030 [Geobacillus virus E3]AJA41349.1 hypothetical protein E3_030 [Geobacillus virus E3]
MEIDFSLMPPILYHGSISVYKTSLLKGIDLEKCDERADFGKGFYLTTRKEQAEKWAIKNAISYNKKALLQNKEPNAVGMVFVYSVDYTILSKLNGIVLENRDKDWSLFIYHNRIGSNKGINNIDAKYDFVYGSLADGKINTLAEQLKMGLITFEEFDAGIRPFSSLGDQLSLHTEEALKSVKLKNMYTVINTYQRRNQHAIK